MNWKLTAIIFMMLFILETAWIGFGLYLVLEEEEQFNTCYYEICEGYPQSWFYEDICYCYDYDTTGELQLVVEKWMK